MTMMSLGQQLNTIVSSSSNYQTSSGLIVYHISLTAARQCQCVVVNSVLSATACYNTE